MSLTEAQRAEIQGFVESYIDKLLRPNILVTGQSPRKRILFLVKDLDEKNLQGFIEDPLSASDLIAFNTIGDSAESVVLSTSPAQATEPLVRVIARAVEVLGTSEKALRWLNVPIRSLGDRTAASLLSTPDGISSVEDALGRIEHGVW